MMATNTNSNSQQGATRYRELKVEDDPVQIHSQDIIMIGSVKTSVQIIKHPRSYSMLLMAPEDVLSGGSYEIRGTATIGQQKKRGVHVGLQHPSVSEKHARIYTSRGDWFFQDYNSTHGTIVFRSVEGDPCATNPDSTAATTSAPLAAAPAAAAVVVEPRGNRATGKRKRAHLENGAVMETAALLPEQGAQAPNEGPDEGAVSRAGDGLLKVIILSLGGVENGSHEVLPGPVINVGRVKRGNQLVLKDYGVSERHARLFWQDGQLVVEDRGSRFGTRVEHSCEGAPVLLQSGDTIGFGDVRLEVEVSESILGTTMQVMEKGVILITVTETFSVDVGRVKRSNQLVVNKNGTVSERHARMFIKGGKCYVEDKGSTNGSRVIRQVQTGIPEALTPNSKVDMGNSQLQFTSLSPPAPKPKSPPMSSKAPRSTRRRTMDAAGRTTSATTTPGTLSSQAALSCPAAAPLNHSVASTPAAQPSTSVPPSNPVLPPTASAGTAQPPRDGPSSKPCVLSAIRITEDSDAARGADASLDTRAITSCQASASLRSRPDPVCLPLTTMNPPNSQGPSTAPLSRKSTHHPPGVHTQGRSREATTPSIDPYHFELPPTPAPGSKAQKATSGQSNPRPTQGLPSVPVNSQKSGEPTSSAPGRSDPPASQGLPPVTVSSRQRGKPTSNAPGESDPHAPRDLPLASLHSSKTAKATQGATGQPEVRRTRDLPPVPLPRQKHQPASSGVTGGSAASARQGLPHAAHEVPQAPRSLPPTPLNSQDPTPLNSQNPTPLNSQNPTPLNSQHPTPLNSQNPIPLNSQHPTPLNSQNPTPLNSQNPTPLNSQNPTPLNSQHPTLLNSQNPIPLNSQHPTPLNSQHPTPLNSQHPTPLNSQHPTPLNSQNHPQATRGVTGGSEVPAPQGLTLAAHEVPQAPQGLPTKPLNSQKSGQPTSSATGGSQPNAAQGLPPMPLNSQKSGQPTSSATGGSQPNAAQGLPPIPLNSHKSGQPTSSGAGGSQPHAAQDLTSMSLRKRKTHRSPGDVPEGSDAHTGHDLPPPEPKRHRTHVATSAAVDAPSMASTHPGSTTQQEVAVVQQAAVVQKAAVVQQAAIVQKAAVVQQAAVVQKAAVVQQAAVVQKAAVVQQAAVAQQAAAVHEEAVPPEQNPEERQPGDTEVPEATFEKGLKTGKWGKGGKALQTKGKKVLQTSDTTVVQTSTAPSSPSRTKLLADSSRIAEGVDPSSSAPVGVNLSSSVPDGEDRRYPSRRRRQKDHSMYPALKTSPSDQDRHPAGGTGAALKDLRGRRRARAAVEAQGDRHDAHAAGQTLAGGHNADAAVEAQGDRHDAHAAGQALAGGHDAGAAVAAQGDIHDAHTSGQALGARHDAGAAEPVQDERRSAHRGIQPTLSPGRRANYYDNIRSVQNSTTNSLEQPQNQASKPQPAMVAQTGGGCPPLGQQPPQHAVFPHLRPPADGLLPWASNPGGGRSHPKSIAVGIQPQVQNTSGPLQADLHREVLDSVSILPGAVHAAGGSHTQGKVLESVGILHGAAMGSAGSIQQGQVPECVIIRGAKGSGGCIQQGQVLESTSVGNREGGSGKVDPQGKAAVSASLPSGGSVAGVAAGQDKAPDSGVVLTSRASKTQAAGQGKVPDSATLLNSGAPETHTDAHDSSAVLISPASETQPVGQGKAPDSVTARNSGAPEGGFRVPANIPLLSPPLNSGVCPVVGGALRDKVGHQENGRAGADKVTDMALPSNVLVPPQCNMQVAPPAETAKRPAWVWRRPGTHSVGTAQPQHPPSQQTTPQTSPVPQTTHQQHTAPQTTHQTTLVPQTTHQPSAAPQTTHQQHTAPQTTPQTIPVPQSTHQHTAVPQTTHQQRTAPPPSAQPWVQPSGAVPDTPGPKKARPALAPITSNLNILGTPFVAAGSRASSRLDKTSAGDENDENSLPHKTLSDHDQKTSTTTVSDHDQKHTIAVLSDHEQKTSTTTLADCDQKTSTTNLPVHDQRDLPVSNLNPKPATVTALQIRPGLCNAGGNIDSVVLQCAGHAAPATDRGQGVIPATSNEPGQSRLTSREITLQTPSSERALPAVRQGELVCSHGPADTQGVPHPPGQGVNGTVPTGALAVRVDATGVEQGAGRQVDVGTQQGGANDIGTWSVASCKWLAQALAKMYNIPDLDFYDDDDDDEDEEDLLQDSDDEDWVTETMTHKDYIMEKRKRLKQRASSMEATQDIEKLACLNIHRRLLGNIKTFLMYNPGQPPEECLKDARQVLTQIRSEADNC